MKIGFISLGCAKNRVDTEIMMGLLKANGHSMVDRLEYAELAIINTCGFLTEAKEEAIDQILAAAKLKEKGLLKYLIITGCMAQLHAQELLDEIPELDGVVGISSYLDIPALINQIIAGQKINAVKSAPETFIEEGPRVLTTPAGMGYIKISEGCNNRCSYCAIPLIRGQLRSRSLNNAVEEAGMLLDRGIKELVIIGQDPASYGSDVGKPGDLIHLIAALDQFKGEYWVRLMYLHPAHLSTSIIEAIAQSKHTIPYLDIPIQHAAQPVLVKMNRHHGEEQLRARLLEMKKNIPDLVLRTTVMVGFPGETEDDFKKLCDFIQEYSFDWLGAFAFSPQADTPAEKMPDQVPEEIKAARLNEILAIQSRITRKKNISRLGKVERILISSRNSANLYVGRGYYQAPEVDGITLVKSNENIHTGEFVWARLVGVRKYDMIGELSNELTQ